MNNNFECRYMSVGGTFCFYYDKELEYDSDNDECNNCEMNNSCEYCAWKISHQENCNNCSVLEVENE